MFGRVSYGKEGIASGCFMVADRDGARVAAGIAVETTGFCCAVLDFWHDDLNMFHDVLR